MPNHKCYQNFVWIRQENNMISIPGDLCDVYENDKYLSLTLTDSNCMQFPIAWGKKSIKDGSGSYASRVYLKRG